MNDDDREKLLLSVHETVIRLDAKLTALINNLDRRCPGHDRSIKSMWWVLGGVGFMTLFISLQTGILTLQRLETLANLIKATI